MATSSEMTILRQSQFRLVEKVEKVSFELECELMLTEDRLTWIWQSPPAGIKQSSQTEKHVRLSWVLKAEVKANAATEDKDNEDIPSKLVIHFVNRVDKAPHFELCLDEVSLQGPASQCNEWVKLLTEHLQRKFPQRPKSLLIIINPCSGGNKGEKIYNTDIAPIFKLAGIKAEVRVTTKPKDPINILGNYDLSKVDGVISMGGDGTHFEVISALIETTMKAAGVEDITPSTVLQSPTVKHGSIPAGTGNGGQIPTSYNKDPATSAIVIALGDCKPRDILSMYSGGKFISYCFLGCGFGLMSQGMDVLEHYRWIGPLRYIALVFVTVIKRSPVRMIIDYLPDKTLSEGAAGVVAGSSTNTNQDTNTATVSASDDKVQSPAVLTEDADKNDLPPGWQRLDEKILEADMFCLPNMDTLDMYGFYLTDHTMPSGVFSLVYTRPCGRIAHMKYLGKLIKGKFGQGVKEFEAVETVNVRALRVRAVLEPGDDRPLSRISCDGETAEIYDRQFEVRCHAGLISSYARTDGEELRKFCETDSPS